MGNNAIHYAIIEESNEILYELTNSDKYSIKPNFNIHNISGKLPLHILLYKDKVNENETTKKIIYYTDLNFQDNEGNTPMHLLCKKNIWKTYSDIIIKKKLDVFIKNNKNIRPIDLIDKKELNEFIDLVSHSYLYILRNYNFVWKNIGKIYY
jgi:ankyrin repeat protein